MKKIIIVLTVFAFNSSLQAFAQTSQVNHSDTTKSSAAVKKTGFNPDAFVSKADSITGTKSTKKEIPSNSGFNATAFQTEARKQELKLGINSKN